MLLFTQLLQIISKVILFSVLIYSILELRLGLRNRIHINPEKIFSLFNATIWFFYILLFIHRFHFKPDCILSLGNIPHQNISKNVHNFMLILNKNIINN